MVLRKSFYIRWSAGRSPRVHEVNPGRDPSVRVKIRYRAKFGCRNLGIETSIRHILQLGSQTFFK